MQTKIVATRAENTLDLNEMMERLRTGNKADMRKPPLTDEEVMQLPVMNKLREQWSRHKNCVQPEDALFMVSHYVRNTMQVLLSGEVIGYEKANKRAYELLEQLLKENMRI